MKLSDYTISLLEDIEKRIDPESEERYMEDWRKFWDGGFCRTVFRPHRMKTICGFTI